MKNFKSILMGVALVVISGAVLASGNLQVNIFPVSKNKTMVHVTNVEKSKYEIEVKNEKGAIVYYKRTVTPQATYAKYYNFSMLNDGDYRLTVKVNNEKMENTLRIQNGQAELVDQRKEVEPFFTLKDNRLELSWLNFAQEDARILVYEDNTLIFEKNLDPKFTVNYALDLSNLGNGNYNAVLVTDNNYFSYPVEKK
jgi:hypothetical protein